MCAFFACSTDLDICRYCSYSCHFSDARDNKSRVSQQAGRMLVIGGLTAIEYAFAHKDGFETGKLPGRK